jgi:hypothetical protein
LTHSIVAPHELMAQLVTIELKPLVKIRNWNRDCINPAKYSQTAHGSPCPIAPVVANFSMRRVPQAVAFPGAVHVVASTSRKGVRLRTPAEGSS